MLPRRTPSLPHVAALLLTLLAAACAAPSPRATAPRVPRVTASQRATPSSAPANGARATSAAAPSAAASAVAVSADTPATDLPADAAPGPRFARVELVRFPTRLSRELPRVTDELVTVLADDGRRALRPASLWFGEARHSVPAALWEASRATGLWQDLVAFEGDEQLVLQLDEPAPASPHPTQLRVELRPAAADAHWSVNLVARGPRPDTAAALADIDADDRAPRPESFSTPRAERLLLRPFRATSERALTLLLPSPWDVGWLGLRVTPAQPGDTLARTALAAADARRGIVLTPLAIPPDPSAGDATAVGLARVLREGLARGETRRATLLHAATTARLALLGDLALVAPRALVDAMATRAAQRLEAGQPVSLRTLLGALLEALGEQPPDQEATPRLDAVLREHLGALDRRRSLITDALPGFVDDAAFEDFLRRENALLLDDSRPETRLRAHEFLARRKLAPPGYDPLGTRAERRAALEAAAAAAAEAEGAP